MFIFTLVLTIDVFAQTAVKPAGSGTSTDPYQIATLDNLYWLSQADTAWDKYYVQTANIDASATKNWDGGKGFSPIGDDIIKFIGTYDGAGYNISNLTINQGKYVGLFGFSGNSAVIKNVSLLKASISGGFHYTDYIGAIAGYNFGTIKNSNAQVTASGGSDIGGIAGINSGSISNSYTKGTISGTENSIGGLVGSNDGSIDSSYSMCTISGNSWVGG